jgi:hypothetical protein
MGNGNTDIQEEGEQESRSDSRGAGPQGRPDMLNEPQRK